MSSCLLSMKSANALLELPAGGTDLPSGTEVSTIVNFDFLSSITSNTQGIAGFQDCCSSCKFWQLVIQLQQVPDLIVGSQLIEVSESKVGDDDRSTDQRRVYVLNENGLK